MSLQQYFNDFSTGYWANEDATLCGCRGGGWALSDVDTWHQCPYHTGPHPEDYPSDADMDAMQYKPAAPECEPLNLADVPF